jgi:hypothetical protein
LHLNEQEDDAVEERRCGLKLYICLATKRVDRASEARTKVVKEGLKYRVGILNSADLPPVTPLSRFFKV